MAFLGGLFGGQSPPSFSPSPEFQDLQFNVLFPKIKELINQGGLKFNTAALERNLKEDIGANFGEAFRRIRSKTLPFGNPAAGNRLALNVSTRQAQEISRGLGAFRSDAEQARLNSLMGVLGLASKLEDPNLRPFQAGLQGFQAGQQERAMTAGILGDLASLGTLLFI